MKICKVIKNLLTFSALVLTLSIFTTVNAQEAAEYFSDPDYLTNIQSADFAEINSPIIFSAQPQFNTTNTPNLIFEWDFGDYNYDQGPEVAHTFNKPGKYNVKLTVKDNKVTIYENIKEIFIPIKAAVFITDKTEQVNKIRTLINTAQDANIYLKLIDSFNSQSVFLAEEILTKKLNKVEAEISKISTIVTWTEAGSGMNALLRYQQNGNKTNYFKNSTIIVVDNNKGNIQRVKRQFNQIQPKEIIIIQEAGLIQFIDTPNIQEFKDKLNKGGFEYTVIDKEKSKVNPINILSYFIDYLTEKGIPDNTLVLILLLPIIATVIAFMKQVIGITTLGIYTPTIITLTFLVLGLKFGIVILFFVVLLGSIAHKLVKPLKLLYIPKMAIVMTTVSLIIFLLLSITVYLNLFEIEYISLAIFPVVIMGTLTEKFVSIRSEKGLSSSVLIMVETFFVSLVAYFAAGGSIDLIFAEIQFSYLRNLILNTPEIIFLIILINIYLGRWTGLQVTEYIQFRDVLNDEE
jgi:PKD repeat protein